MTAVDSGSKALELLGLLESNGEESDSDQSPVSHPDDQDLHDQDVVEVNLIITDYCMPGMTGYDLLRKIKESKNLKDIPVVIMSSENIPSRINRCLEEGAEEFLLKPVQLSDVDKLKPHLMRSKSKECDFFEANNCKRKSDDECVSPNKSRMKMTDIQVPAFLG